MYICFDHKFFVRYKCYGYFLLFCDLSFCFLSFDEQKLTMMKHNLSIFFLSAYCFLYPVQEIFSFSWGHDDIYLCFSFKNLQSGGMGYMTYANFFCEAKFALKMSLIIPVMCIFKITFYPMWGRHEVHFWKYKSPLIQVPFIERTFLSPLDCFCAFVKNKLSV